VVAGESQVTEDQPSSQGGGTGGRERGGGPQGGGARQEGRRIAEDGLRSYAPLLHALVGRSAIIKYDDTNMNIEANASEGRLNEADDGTPRTNASSTKVRPDPNVV
jgi:hypothetical protein